MPTHSISFQNRVEIPFDVGTLDRFRLWSQSGEFPQRGRIDFIDGRIEVDMSPEQAFSHGTPKVELVRVLGYLVKDADNGMLFSDGVRLVNTVANLSSEPDLLFISDAAVATQRIRLIPSRTQPDDGVEFEGTPDLVVEIVSRSSVRKDTVRLQRAYFEAGITEYWIVDARRSLKFVIQMRGETGFVPRPISADGYQRSTVFEREFNLVRRQSPSGRIVFDLNVR